MGPEISGSTLPIPSRMSDEIRLLCLVQGDPIDRIFKVHVKLADTVADLREAILQKKPSFKNIDADELEPRKFDIPVARIDDNTAYVNELGNGQELTPLMVISTVWKDQPPGDTLSVVLPRPAGTMITPSSSKQRKFSDEGEDESSDQRPAKRQRLGFTQDPVYALMWDTFWGKSPPECFVEEEVYIPDPGTLNKPDKPTTFTYMRLPDDTCFPCGARRILITSTYTEFYEELCREDLRWIEDGLSCLSSAHSTIVRGALGIGKGTGLSYFLARRLQDKKPTVYCDYQDFAYSFTDTGVEEVTLHGGRVLDALHNVDTCALVNLNPAMEAVPSPFHLRPLRRGRVVVATSVHGQAIRKDRIETYTWPMWEWEDIYCARMISWPDSRKPPSDEQLWDMFTVVGGVPRRCFQALAAEQRRIMDAVNEIKPIEQFQTSIP